MRGALLYMALASTLATAQPETEGRVTVTATRDERPLETHPGNVAIIPGDELRFVAATHPSELLARVPGAWVTRGSGQEHLTAIRSPILTGAGACGAFLLLEDSVPVRAPGFCNVNGLFELNLDSAHTVEVVRGPGSARYGSNAMHGLVNALMPRPGVGFPQRIGLEAGGRGYMRASLSNEYDGNMRTDASITHDDGWRDASGFEIARLNVAWDAGGSEWSAAATGLFQETAGFIVGENAYRDRALSRSNPTPGAFRDARSFRIRASTRVESGGWIHSLRPYARANDMRFLMHFLPGTPVEENAHTSLGFQWQVERGELAFGADIELTRGSLAQIQADELVGASPFLDATRPRGVHYDFTVDAMTVAVFGEAGVGITRDWRLTGGLRAEHTRYDYDNRAADGNLREDGTPCAMGGCIYNRPADRDDSFTTLAPHVALLHALAPGVQAFASATVGFRAPQVSELYRLQRGQSVADLDAERLDAVEIGLRGTGIPVAFEITAFAMRKRNFVFQDSAGFAVSDGRTHHRGIEFEIDAMLGDRFEMGANATLARHRYDFDRSIGAGDVVVGGNEMETAPRVIGSARFAWIPDRDTRIEIEGVHIGGHWLDAANLNRYGGHTIHNLRGTHRIDGWSLDWRITNLANRAYAERADFAFGAYRYFPGPPRTALVGLSLGF